MKIIWLSIFVFFVSNADASEALVVTLAKNGHHPGIWVDLRIQNTSKELECVNGALIGLDGAIVNSVFTINGPTGDAPFKGVTFILDQSYEPPVLTLQPGQTVGVNVNLSNIYDLKRAKNYEIRFDFLNIASCKGHHTAAQLRSNTLIWK